MYIDNRTVKNPTFSICIPQYNRTSFLLESLKALEDQTFQNFEVCISDDCSNDGRENEIIEFLSNSTLSYVYKRQESNLRYDGNIRESIGLANGKYCFLQGNDDCLASKSTLEDINNSIENYDFPEVVITNFQDYESGDITRRAKRSRIIGEGGSSKAIPISDIPGYEKRITVTPGLTGIAQIFAPRDIARKNKFVYDLLYIKKQSFKLDIKLILLSFWITFRGKWETRGKKF